MLIHMLKWMLADCDFRSQSSSPRTSSRLVSVPVTIIYHWYALKKSVKLMQQRTTAGSEIDASDIRLEEIFFIMWATAFISGPPPQIAHCKI